MSSVDSILDVDTFSKYIGLQTVSANKYLNNKIKEWSNDKKRLSTLSLRFRRFKDAMKKDPDFYKECHEYFKEIAECEKELNDLITSESDLEKESYNEILFFRPILKPLNFSPYLLTFWSFLRVYLLPGLSFIVPIITLLAPYIVLKVAFNMPITLNSYMHILHSMVSGNFDQVMNPDAIMTISPVNFLKQFGIVIVTLVQGIIQPYWTYKHLRSIDQIILDKGRLVNKFKQLYDALETTLVRNGFTFFKSPLPHIRNNRNATAHAMFNASYFKLALKYIGSLEVMMCLANQKDFYPVKWVRSAEPVFIAKHTFDFNVPSEVRKSLSVKFDKNRHALLTGPNKGGKSTVLRALSISTLLAHTYGCAPGHVTLTPFSKMFVCLKPDDLPGSKSRFEREIEFTANTLKNKEHIMILIDELYHSTNPPDALRSCQIYCDQLWKKPNMVSIISTHLFELVEKAPDNIQKLCCPAKINNDKIHFNYTLNKGICKVSSVDELLRVNGLL